MISLFDPYIWEDQSQNPPVEGISSEVEGTPQDSLIDEEKLANKWVQSADASAEDKEAAQKLQNKRMLDQAEIDSLLGTGNDDLLHKVGIDVLLDSSTVTYERLPMLEIVFDRLVKLLTTSLRNFTSDTVEVQLEKMTSLRFGEYIDSVSLPTLLGVFKAKQWENNSFIITINNSLSYAIVDVLLGGKKGTTTVRSDGRPYSTIERNLIQRLFNVVIRDLGQAFDPITKVDFFFDRMETSPRFATIARPVNASIVVSIRVEMDDRAGNIEILLPYSSIEPIRELLLQMFMGEKFGHDNIWENHLAHELWSTRVPLTGILGKTTSSLNDVLNWKPGSQVMLPTRTDDAINIMCGNIIVGKGHMGTKGKNVSIMMDRFYLNTKKENE